MVEPLLDKLLEVVFWPGDTIIAWLLATHPQLALWLGLDAGHVGGLVSALISLLAGWCLYMGMAHLMLLGVQLWERRTCHPNAEAIANDSK